MTASPGYRVQKAAGAGGAAAAHSDQAEMLGAVRPEIVDDWAELFQAMADTNRLRMLLAIHHTPGINVTDLADTVGMTANATSHALAALRLRGIIRSERAGRERRWSIANGQIHALLHQVGATHSPLHPAH